MTDGEWSELDDGILDGASKEQWQMFAELVAAKVADFSGKRRGTWRWMCEQRAAMANLERGMKATLKDGVVHWSEQWEQTP